MKQLSEFTKEEQEIMLYEINARVEFKLNDIESVITNIESVITNIIQYERRDSFFTAMDGKIHESLKHSANQECLERIYQIFRKEMNMTLPCDEMDRLRIRKFKNKFVSLFCERLLKQGTRDYQTLESFINDKIENLIFTARNLDRHVK